MLIFGGFLEVLVSVDENEEQEQWESVCQMGSDFFYCFLLCWHAVYQQVSPFIRNCFGIELVSSPYFLQISALGIDFFF